MGYKIKGLGVGRFLKYFIEGTIDNGTKTCVQGCVSKVCSADLIQVKIIHVPPSGIKGESNY